MLLAATSWPEAAIAIAGIGFIPIVLSVLIWQIFGTGRTAIAGQNDKEYRKLVDELREQTRELAAGLEEVDRVLKAVE